jgi:hypothetical protein
MTSDTMRRFLAIPSERFESGGWVVREAIDGRLGPPLFVGAKEAAEFEEDRLNRNEQARYTKASSDHLIEAVRAFGEANQQERAALMDRLIRDLEERVRYEEAYGLANSMCLTALSLPA